MKLYTEEQVKEVIAYYNTEKFVTTDELLKDLRLTPIELPSDEEIENMAIEYFNDAEGIEYEKGFYKIGAKMVINKIQGGNK